MGQRIGSYSFAPCACCNCRPGQSPLSWSARLKIARGAARGLAHLHECSPRRFVHGEVKPSNILLEHDLTDLTRRRARRDFGLARLLAVAGCAPDAPSSTAGGGLLGGAIPYAKTPAPAPGGPGPGGSSRAAGPGTNASPSTSASFSAPVSGSTAATGTDRSGSGEHGPVPEVVRWVRRGFEEDARPVAEMVDPALLRVGPGGAPPPPPLPKKEVVAAFHVALACTEVDPEMRPRMKAVADSLDKIGS
ncbi:hypothetical protein PR202_ga03646 [Eleusine coracana subsp. coracana]|uniref:Protein kinase domain-containing protein n=1 Tax=Eleusine coracana subsp. coracana TaxID=191504 RepID=A0AAV5BPW2_ELECO|nr:hypothetical protein PR202_ga03646 [Eleusine coracana subsp. coracana]